MKYIHDTWDHIIGPWVMKRVGGGEWFTGRGHTIGLYDTSRGIMAGVVFESYNGASIILHLASDGRNWLNREFLWFVFYYPFVQLGLNKIICTLDPDSHASIRLCKHMGFTLEATLRDASPKGDLLLFTLARAECKWLSLKEKYRGQAQGSSAA